jgi:hypothetical protein
MPAFLLKLTAVLGLASVLSIAAVTAFAQSNKRLDCRPVHRVSTC